MRRPCAIFARLYFILMRHDRADSHRPPIASTVINDRQNSISYNLLPCACYAIGQVSYNLQILAGVDHPGVASCCSGPSRHCGFYGVSLGCREVGWKGREVFPNSASQTIPNSNANGMDFYCIKSRTFLAV